MKLKVLSKEYELKWGLKTLLRLSREFKIDSVYAEENLTNLEVLVPFIYCALRADDLTYEEFEDWIDDADQKLLVDIVQDYVQSRVEKSQGWQDIESDVAEKAGVADDTKKKGVKRQLKK